MTTTRGTTRKRAPAAPPLPAVTSLGPADVPKLEHDVAEAVTLAKDAATTGAAAYRALADRLVELRLALDDMDGRTEAYRQARHRAFWAGGVTTNVESARLERNVRYHIGEVLAERGLRPRSASRAPERRADTLTATATRALVALRRLRKLVEGQDRSSEDKTDMLDVLDEVESLIAQVRRRLTLEARD